MEKDPIRTFPWMKVPTTAFTFKTLDTMLNRRFLNVKALVGTFNQEAFADGSFAALMLGRCVTEHFQFAMMLNISVDWLLYCTSLHGDRCYSAVETTSNVQRNLENQ